MSQENVEIVRSVLAAISAGDRDKALAFADPEIVVDMTRNVFNPATYVGISGLQRMIADMDETWEEIHTEPYEYIDAGDRVVVIGQLVGRGKGSGVEVERPTAHVWTVRNGRVVRWVLNYTNRSEALEAAGLEE
jgi:ketosteroid isomerase-like protein